MSIRIVDNFTQVLELLKYYSPYLESLRTGEINIATIAEKLTTFGIIVEIHEEDSHIGFAAFYCNDNISKIAFLSLIAVSTEFESKGYGTFLLDEVEKICGAYGMKIIRLEVKSKNTHAIGFYKYHGYIITSTTSKGTYYMEKRLNIGGKNE